MLKIPRPVALQALMYCDQLEAELEQGASELVIEKMRRQFQGWLDDFDHINALVALKAIRAFASEVLNADEDECEGS